MSGGNSGSGDCTPPPCTGDMSGTGGDNCGPPPCESDQLSSALTDSAALALRLLSVVHPELSKLSQLAADRATESCGGNQGQGCTDDMSGGTDNGNGNNGENNGCGHTPITICHATGSATNPFVEITIDENGLNGHAGDSAGRHGPRNASGDSDSGPAGGPR
jgi:hypothetical protein